MGVLGTWIKLLPDLQMFSCELHKMHLAAWLCPDPLGEVLRSPNPIAVITGIRGREGKERVGNREERGRGRI